MKEISSNQQASADASALDTFDRYLNLTAYGHFRDHKGRPGIKPPWGMHHAINLHTGEYAWSVPLGNVPELQEGPEETGDGGSAGPTVTAGGLVFIGSTRDNKFRAFDKTTGEKLWEFDLPGVANANASTYQVDGKQYIAISVGSDEAHPAGTVMAFALPD